MCFKKTTFVVVHFFDSYSNQNLLMFSSVGWKERGKANDPVVFFFFFPLANSTWYGHCLIIISA